MSWLCRPEMGPAGWPGAASPTSGWGRGSGHRGRWGPPWLTLRTPGSLLGGRGPTHGVSHAWRGGAVTQGRVSQGAGTRSRPTAASSPGTTTPWGHPYLPPLCAHLARIRLLSGHLGRPVRLAFRRAHCAVVAGPAAGRRADLLLDAGRPQPLCLAPGAPAVQLQIRGQRQGAYARLGLQGGEQEVTVLHGGGHWAVGLAWAPSPPSLSCLAVSFRAALSLKSLPTASPRLAQRSTPPNPELSEGRGHLGQVGGRGCSRWNSGGRTGPARSFLPPVPGQGRRGLRLCSLPVKATAGPGPTVPSAGKGPRAAISGSQGQDPPCLGTGWSGNCEDQAANLRLVRGLAGFGAKGLS